MRSRKARQTGASAVEQPGSPTSADFALVGVEVFTIALPAQSVVEIECLWTDRKHAVCNLAKSWCQCRGRFKRCQLSRILFPPPNIVTNPVTFLYLIDLVRRQIVQALGQALGQRTSTDNLSADKINEVKEGYRIG